VSPSQGVTRPEVGQRQRGAGPEPIRRGAKGEPPDPDPDPEIESESDPETGPETEAETESSPDPDRLGLLPRHPSGLRSDDTLPGVTPFRRAVVG